MGQLTPVYIHKQIVYALTVKTETKSLFMECYKIWSNNNKDKKKYFNKKHC